MKANSQRYQDKRNSLGLIAVALALISVALPWYELSGELEGGVAYWLVYPLTQNYNSLVESVVFPENWRNSAPPMPRVAVPLLLSAIICAYSSLVVKSWTKRALGLTISTFIMLVAIGDFVQGWLFAVMLSGLPTPPGELNFQDYVVAAKWGPGILLAGVTLVLMGLGVGLELLKTFVLMGKEAAEAIKKMHSLD